MRAIPGNRTVATCSYSRVRINTMLLYLLHTYTSSKHEWDFKAVDCCACVEVLKRLTERELEVLYLVAALWLP